jgi:hypothetical protein
LGLVLPSKTPAKDVMLQIAECCAREAHDPPKVERFGDRIMRQATKGKDF